MNVTIARHPTTGGDGVLDANAAILAGVSGSLIAPHVDERWRAALAGGESSVVETAS